MNNFKISCTTETIRSHPSNHFVHIDISPKVYFKVIDAATHEVKDEGTSGWTGTRRTITSLDSSYYVEAQSSDSTGPRNSVFG